MTICPDSDIAKNYERLVARGKTKQKAMMMVLRRLVKASFWILKEDRDFAVGLALASTPGLFPAAAPVHRRTLIWAFAGSWPSV